MDIDSAIKKLAESCNLGKIVNMPERVSGGLLNRMYKVKTDSGIWAIKLLNPEVMKRENAKYNHIFAESVANIAKENGVSCLPAKIVNGNILQEIDGYYFLIFDWIDGKTITDKDLTIPKAEAISRELVKLHKIDYKELKEKCKAYDHTEIVDWRYYLDKTENEKIKELIEKNADRFYFLDKRAIESLEVISDNMVISHRDLDLPNILWDENDKPIIIDWESTGLVNPIMELIDTAWNWSGGQNYFDKEKYQAFVKTYRECGGDLRDYKEALKADFKAKFGWLEYNIKRVCGIELLDEEERKLGESEVIRTIDEINKFDLYSKDMEI